MKRTIAVLSLLAVMCFVGQAKAADAPGHSLIIGGAVRGDMAWQVLGDDSRFANNSDSTITNFFATVNSDSYLRATFTSADKNTGALIEFGMYSAMNGDNAGYGGDDNKTKLRYAYGWWNVGSCKLLLGQIDSRLGDGNTMSNIGDSKSGKSGSCGFGFIGATRNPKVALQVEANDYVNFEVSLGQAGAETTTVLPNAYSGLPISSTNSYLPRLEAVVDFTIDNFAFGLGGGIAYQEMKANDRIINSLASNAEYDDKVLSYLLWVPVTYKNGPFSVLFNAHFGQNVDTDWTGENTTDFDFWGNPNGIYGNQPGSLPVAQATANGYEMKDTMQWGLGIDFNYELTDKLMLALGGGLTHLQNDAWDVANGKDNYSRWTVYVAAPYQVTSNFTIAPEIGYYNYGDIVGTDTTNTKDKAGDEWLVGIHFQFLF